MSLYQLNRGSVLANVNTVNTVKGQNLEIVIILYSCRMLGNVKKNPC